MTAPHLISASRVLVVGGTTSVQEVYREALNQAAPLQAPSPAPLFLVDFVTQGPVAVAHVRQAVERGRPYAVVFVELGLGPIREGTALIRQLWAITPALPVVLCPAPGDQAWQNTVLALAPTDPLAILRKPCDPLEIRQLARILIRPDAAVPATGAPPPAGPATPSSPMLGDEPFLHVFHSTPFPLALQTLAEGRFLAVNPAFEHLTGHPPDATLHRTCEELGLWADPAERGAALRDLTARLPVLERRIQIRARSGLIREISLSMAEFSLGAEPCTLAVFRDITDQLHFERRLHQTQKMDAIGQLAGGIAHDFNNILTVIMGNASLVVDQENLTEAQRANLAQTLAAGKRAVALTRELIYLRRKQHTQDRPVDLAALVRQQQARLAALLPPKVSLDFENLETLPPLVANQAGLEHILLNLVVSARDAVAAAGGRITVRLDQVSLAEDALRHAEARPGRFIRLAVADTGRALEPAERAQLFDPFYAHKQIGRGTGLTHFTVQAIAHQHQGWAEVASPPGGGVVLSIYLPAGDDLDRPPLPVPLGPAIESPAEELKTLRGHERILVVEDDPSIRSFLVAVLTGQGYQVTEAGDGPHALRAWEAARGEFDLLLTDMVMPNGMSGADVAIRLRSTRTDLKIIICTGYSPVHIAQKTAQLGELRVILKPFIVTKLLRTLRDTLDARPPALVN